MSPVSHSVAQLGHQDRDELRIALTAAQESAIIQLLLEVCLPQEDDRKVCAMSVGTLYQDVLFCSVHLLRLLHVWVPS